VLGQNHGGAVLPLARQPDECAHAVHRQVAQIRAHRRMGQRPQQMLDAVDGGDRVAKRQRADRTGPARVQPRVAPSAAQQVQRVIARHGARKVTHLGVLVQPAERSGEFIGTRRLALPRQRLEHRMKQGFEVPGE
jgi:hypothetical protein